MRDINIYMASSIRSPKKQKGIGMYVLEAIMTKGPVTSTKEMRMEASKNEAEIILLEDALSRLKEPCRVTIYTNDNFVAMGINNLKTWKENDWKTSRGTEVKNSERWKHIAEKLTDCVYICMLGEPHAYRAWLTAEIDRRLKNEESGRSDRKIAQN